jgi:hypothetical protein
MILYMDDYRKAKQAPQHSLEEYADERLCVNYDPALSAHATGFYQRAHELSPALPPDLATVNVDEFLYRAYTLASQI